jgi:hypothetical protein
LAFAVTTTALSAGIGQAQSNVALHGAPATGSAYFLLRSPEVFIASVYEPISGCGLAQLFMLSSTTGGNQFAVDSGIRHNV